MAPRVRAGGGVTPVVARPRAPGYRLSPVRRCGVGSGPSPNRRGDGRLTRNLTFRQEHFILSAAEESTPEWRQPAAPLGPRPFDFAQGDSGTYWTPSKGPENVHSDVSKAQPFSEALKILRKSWRDTMPTTLPSCRTGMWWTCSLIIVLAMSPTGVAASTTGWPG